MTGTIETTMPSQRLENLISLPPDYQDRMVVVTVRLADNANTVKQNGAALDATSNLSDSFGMWKDRKDMDDVDAYIRSLRKGRTF
jgi:hypothetical protein